MASQCVAPSAELGSREAAVELLAGIAETLITECQDADDFVCEHLAWLLIDVLDAKDALEA